MSLRILVVDPQPFFREALATAVQTADLEIVGITGDEIEAEQMSLNLKPDLVLTELDLADGSGLSLARRLQEKTPVILLTRNPEGDVLFDAVDAGAVGCLGHATGLEDLIRLLGSWSQGIFSMDEKRLLVCLKRANAARRRHSEDSKIADLSAREREVLRLLAKGQNNETIGAALYLSPNTVRTHVGNIFKKLGVHTRADAARVVFEAERSDADRPHVLRITGPNLE